MAGEVSVMGVPREMGDLKESMGAFRKHHAAVGLALMNVQEGRDKDDDRAPYKFQAWPTMLHHPDGRDEAAQDERERAALLKRGFRAEPYLKPQVAVLDPATEKKTLLDQNQQFQAQLTIMADQQAKLLAQLEELKRNSVS